MNANPTRADVERFRRMVASRMGLWFDEHKVADLAALLASRVRARGRTANAYLENIDDRELAALAERLTVGETSFFRYPGHFAVLAAIPGPLRILSIGCATGEEPYSIAIALREQGRDFEVHAFDLNPAAIAHARAGRYTAWALRETPDDTRARYFRKQGGRFQLADEVRAAVTFEQRNLLANDPAFWRPDAFDVVFCRNVVMYFERDTMRSVVARIAASLRPGGRLFLGHAETLRGLSTDFVLQQSEGTFHYRRAGTGASVEPTVLINVPVATTKRVARALAEAPPVDLAQAVTLTNDGKVAEAERACHAILATPGDHAGAHYLLALCRDHAGDREGALEHDRTAVELDARFVMAHVHAGLLERRAGHCERASESLRCALDGLETDQREHLELFAGGFSKHSLVLLCRRELERCKDRA